MYFKVEAFHITDIFHCCNWVVAMRTGQKYLQTTVEIKVELLSATASQDGLTYVTK